MNQHWTHGAMLGIGLFALIIGAALVAEAKLAADAVCAARIERAR